MEGYCESVQYQGLRRDQGRDRSTKFDYDGTGSISQMVAVQAVLPRMCEEAKLDAWYGR